MAINVSALIRVFNWNGVELQDPNPAFTPEKVRDVLSAAYPGLTTAEVSEPAEKNGRLAYEFIKATGTKG